MVDITTPETRTRRLSILDSFMPIGIIVGLPFGTLIKNNLGLVVLYSIAAGITIIAMVYVFFVVKDRRKNFDEEKKQEVKNTKSDVVLGCNIGNTINNEKSNVYNFSVFRFLPWFVQNNDRWNTDHFQAAI